MGNKLSTQTVAMRSAGPGMEKGRGLRKILRKNRILPALLCLLMAFQGCTTLGGSAWVKRHAANGLYPTLNDFYQKALRCDDPVVLKATLESYLLLVETLAEESPKNPDLLVLASTLYAYYSFGFVVHEDLERARKLYWKGIALGKQALMLNPSVKKALDQGEPFYKVVPLLRADRDVPAAFCTALNQGLLLICSLDVMEAFAEANAFRALDEWVIETRETYFHGAAHSLLGVYFGIMPVMAGGGPFKAQKEFEKAISIDNRLLLHYWAYARYYPTLIDDEAFFDELIQHIQEADPSVEPSITALNIISKNKAKLLEQDRDLYF